jgi:cytochrome c oxidase subunit 2
VRPARRRALASLGALVAAAVAGSRAAAPARRVELVAKRFEFMPPEVTVARGTRLTLVVTATDFVHGFSMPDFEVRRDLVPGKAVELTITPQVPGRFHYLCDNFCGEGHDRMSGILVVT